MVLITELTVGGVDGNVRMHNFLIILKLFQKVFLKGLFFFYVCVLLACMRARYVHVWCLQRPPCPACKLYLKDQQGRGAK